MKKAPPAPKLVLLGTPVRADRQGVTLEPRAASEAPGEEPDWDRTPGAVKLDPAHAGVFKTRQRLGGRWCYFAIGCDGLFLSYRRPENGETDAEVIVALFDVMLAHDATVRPALTLSTSEG